MINEFTHVYIFKISELQKIIYISDAKKYLDKNDTEKLEAIKSASRSLEFIYGRYVCKKVIAMYIKPFLSGLNFKYDSRGKPYIECYDKPVKFNLSHSGDFLALVVADKEVGMDIEIVNEAMLPDIKNIAVDQYLEHEAQVVISSSDDASLFSTFYRFWTCKEAALKAIGVGLYHPMQSVDCEKLLKNEAIYLANKDEQYAVKVWYHLHESTLHLAVAKCGAFGETRLYVDNEAHATLTQQIRLQDSPNSVVNFFNAYAS